MRLSEADVIGNDFLVVFDELRKYPVCVNVSPGALVSHGTSVAFDVCLILEIALLEVGNRLLGCVESRDSQSSLCNAVIRRVRATNSRVFGCSRPRFSDAVRSHRVGAQKLGHALIRRAELLT